MNEQLTAMLTAILDRLAPAGDQPVTAPGGFDHPARLLVVVAFAAVGVAFARRARVRERELLRFGPAEVLATVVVRPTPRRAPVVFAAAATAVLSLASAGPWIAHERDVRAGTVMLVLDVSGSMGATDVAPNRLEAAKAAARSFVENLPGDLRAGLVAFSDSANLIAPPGYQRDRLLAGLERLTADGGTVTGDALISALDAIADVTDTRGAGAIILLSDGIESAGTTTAGAAAQRAADDGIPIYTVALGTPNGTVTLPDQEGIIRTTQVPPDTAALAAIAATTGAEAFSAANFSELERVYDTINDAIVVVPVRRDLAALASLAATILLLASGLTFLRR